MPAMRVLGDADLDGSEQLVDALDLGDQRVVADELDCVASAAPRLPAVSTDSTLPPANSDRRRRVYADLRP